MTDKSRAQSSSSSSRADMASLFRLPTVDIADRLNAMLETERRPHYQLHDYLRQRRHRHQPSQSQCSQSQCSSLHSSSKSATRSSRPASSIQPQQHQVVDPSSRSKIVKWLYDCADYLSLKRECVAVATNYVDRFMSTNNSPRSSATATNAKKDTTIYQLVAISSLFLAAKQSDKMLSRNSNSSSSNSATLTLLDASVLVKVSHGSYSAKEILDMEQEILTALDWHLCPPTSLGFAHELIALLVKVVVLKTSRRSDPPENDKKSGKGNHNQRINSISSVVDFTRLQLELAVSDYSSSILVRAPSTIALASVLNSMELLDFSDIEKRSFARLIFDCTHNKLDVESREVNKARAQLQVVFDNHCQSNDVMSCAAAAIKKDSKSTCGSTLSSRSPVSVDNNDIELSLSHHQQSCQSSGSKSNSSRRKSQNQSRVKGSRSRNRQPPQPSPHSVNTASFQRLQLEP